MKRYIFFAFVLNILLYGCKEKSEDTDAVGNARHLLNKRSYQEAIDLLTVELAKDSNSNLSEEKKISRKSEMRLLLASAYAGSVGLDLIDSYSAFEEVLFKDSLFSKKTVSLLAVEQPPANEAGNSEQASASAPKDRATEILDRQKAELEIFSFLETLLSSTKIIFGLKWIPPNDRVKIIRGAQQLDLIPKNDKYFRTASIYRFVLFSDLFMSTLRDSLGDPKGVFNSSTALFCAMDIANLADTNSKLNLQLNILSVVADEISPDVKEKNPGLVKLLSTFSKLRNFFNSNRSPLNRAYFLQGTLRNDICK